MDDLRWKIFQLKNKRSNPCWLRNFRIKEIKFILRLNEYTESKQYSKLQNKLVVDFIKRHKNWNKSESFSMFPGQYNLIFSSFVRVLFLVYSGD